MLTFDGHGPILVFGGPYSNIWALRALRAEAEALAIPHARVICTGDIVAYCSEPQATVTAIRDWGCHVIAGNCETQLAAGATDCGCGFEDGTACDLLAKGWYPFAAARVTAADKAWMGTLPLSLRFQFGGRAFHVLHGGSEIINKFVFASETASIAAEWAEVHADIVVAGHAGLPFIAPVTAVGRRGFWFNPGVIGMPANDGTASVWYGLISRQNGNVMLSTRRLAYDHVAAAAHMRRHSYADGYARSLITGLWPSLDILPLTERAATGQSLRAKQRKWGQPPLRDCHA